MTADRAWLDEVQARADAATDGPWTVDGKIVWGADPRGRRLATQTQRTEPDDLAFIAAARTDVPRLLALVRAQNAALDAVRELAVPWAENRGASALDDLRDALALADPEKEK